MIVPVACKPCQMLAWNLTAGVGLEGMEVWTARGNTIRGWRPTYSGLAYSNYQRMTRGPLLQLQSESWSAISGCTVCKSHTACERGCTVSTPIVSVIVAKPQCPATKQCRDIDVDAFQWCGNVLYWETSLVCCRIVTCACGTRDNTATTCDTSQ